MWFGYLCWRSETYKSEKTARIDKFQVYVRSVYNEGYKPASSSTSHHKYASIIAKCV